MSNVNWNKIKLTDEVIKKLADFYFTEIEWFYHFKSSGGKFDPMLAAEQLANKRRVTSTQLAFYRTEKEWTDE